MLVKANEGLLGQVLGDVPVPDVEREETYETCMFGAAQPR
jgi:hypothetical protein